MKMKKLIDVFTRIPRFLKVVILIMNDIMLSIASFFVVNQNIYFSEITSFAIIITLTTIISFYYLGIYLSKLKFLSNQSILQVIKIFSAFFISSLLFNFFNNNSKVNFYYLLLYLFLILFSRLSAQSIFYKKRNDIKNILIYGAGESGNKLYGSLKSHSSEYNVVGFIDDDKSKQNEIIDSINVYSREKIPFLLNKFNCYGVFIAMPSIDSETKKNILINLLHENIVIKIVPSVKSLVEKTSNFSDMRNISIEDLIDRSVVNPIESILKENIGNKTILVTGGGGSIGYELVNQILFLNPKKVVVIEQNELNVHNLLNGVQESDNLVTILGTLLDKSLLLRVFKDYKFDIILHAAAYKHVSIVEDNILSGSINNIMSTFMISEFATKNNVKNFTLVSTDKAVRPTNYMGKSKLISEMIVHQFSLKSSTKFNVVRFGNVLNSSGSVLSIFDKQLKNGGPITVTDKKVTRYFMSIPEAAQLILQSIGLKNKFKTFILEMGKAYNIYELAKKIIKINGFELKNDINEGIEIQITGLKEGEKLHEELTYDKQSVEKTDHPKIYATNEKYYEFDVYLWIEKMRELYKQNDFESFKRSIDKLIHRHESLN
tara:strand:- start:365 stop:2173 length:1809 start_codon:yes stop_codon:yes gene_type:complete